MSKNDLAMAVVALMTAVAAPAWAADCGPLKITATVPLRPATGKLAEFVPVMLNGKEKHFLLDTGGYQTQISPAAAKEISLPVSASLGRMDYIGANDVHMRTTTAKEFDMGGLRAHDLPLSLLPMADDDTSLDGLVAIDLLLAHDVDLDFGHDKMNLVSSDHCSGKVVYWPSDVVAELPLRIVNGHYLVSVNLDGKELVAIIDTGSDRSSLGTTGAYHYFGLSSDSPDVTPTDKANGKATAYLHKFGVLKLDSLELHTPTLVIIQTPMLERQRAHRGFEVIGAVSTPWDMILGMDMLRHFHIYIATEERKVYITPA